MVTKEIADLLKRRAESYSVDARKFQEIGDPVWAAAYRAIADELRQCAKEISGEVRRP